MTLNRLVMELEEAAPTAEVLRQNRDELAILRREERALREGQKLPKDRADRLKQLRRADKSEQARQARLAGLKRLQADYVHLDPAYTNTLLWALNEADLYDSFARRGHQMWPADFDPLAPVDQQFRLAEFQNTPYLLPREVVRRSGDLLRAHGIRRLGRDVTTGLADEAAPPAARRLADAATIDDLRTVLDYRHRRGSTRDISREELTQLRDDAARAAREGRTRDERAVATQLYAEYARQLEDANHLPDDMREGLADLLEAVGEVLPDQLRLELPEGERPPTRAEFRRDPLAYISQETADWVIRYHANELKMLDSLNSDMQAALDGLIHKRPDLTADFPAAAPHLGVGEKGGLWRQAADFLRGASSPLRVFDSRQRVPILRAMTMRTHKDRVWIGRLRTAIGDLGPDRIPPYLIQELDAGHLTVQEVLDRVEGLDGTHATVFDRNTLYLRQLLQAPVRSPLFDELWARTDNVTRVRYREVRSLLDDVLVDVNRARVRNGLPRIRRRDGYLPRLMKDVAAWDEQLPKLLTDRDPGAHVLDSRFSGALDDFLSPRDWERTSTPGKHDPFFAHLRQQDVAALRGNMNLVEMLEQYVRSASRAAAWADALPLIRRDVATLAEARPRAAKLLENVVLSELGYPQGMERLLTSAAELIEAGIRVSTQWPVALRAPEESYGAALRRTKRLPVRDLPARRAAAARVAATINRWTARAYLGIKVSSAVRNFGDQARVAGTLGLRAWWSGGVRGTGAAARAGEAVGLNLGDTGWQSGLQAYHGEVFHPGQVQALAEVGVLENYLPFSTAIEGATVGTHWLDAVALSPFQAADYVNRGVAFHTGLVEGLRRGMTPRQAMAAAAEFAERVTFKYGSPYVSTVFRNPLVSGMSSFVKFPLRLFEFTLDQGIAGVRGTEDLLKGLHGRLKKEGLFQGSVSALRDTYRSWRFFALSGLLVGAGDPERLWNNFLQMGSESGVTPAMFGILGAASGRREGWTNRKVRGAAERAGVRPSAAEGIGDLAQGAVRGAAGATVGASVAGLGPDFLPQGSRLGEREPGDRGPEFGTRLAGQDVGVSFVRDAEGRAEWLVQVPSVGGLTGDSRSGAVTGLMRDRDTGRWVDSARVPPSQRGELEPLPAEAGEWAALPLGVLPDAARIPVAALSLGLDFQSFLFGGLLPPAAERALTEGDLAGFLGNMVSSPQIQSAQALFRFMAAGNWTDQGPAAPGSLREAAREEGRGLLGEAGHFLETLREAREHYGQPAPGEIRVSVGRYQPDKPLHEDPPDESSWFLDPFVRLPSIASPQGGSRLAALAAAAVPGWMFGLPLGGANRLTQGLLNQLDPHYSPRSRRTDAPVYAEDLSRGQLFLADWLGLNPSGGARVFDAATRRFLSTASQQELQSYFADKFRRDADHPAALMATFREVQQHIQDRRLEPTSLEGFFRAVVEGRADLPPEFLDLLSRRLSPAQFTKFSERGLLPQLRGPVTFSPTDALSAPRLRQMIDELMAPRGPSPAIQLRRRGRDQGENPTGAP